MDLLTLVESDRGDAVDGGSLEKNKWNEFGKLKGSIGPDGADNLPR